MKKILLIFGTRPEAIKMAPLVKEFKMYQNSIQKCVTAQHEMLDQVLDFEIKVDYDLNIMKPNQNLYSLTATIVESLKPVLEDYNPDYVFVHGDNNYNGRFISKFLLRCQICHVEAGLRTNNKLSPF